MNILQVLRCVVLLVTCDVATGQEQVIHERISNFREIGTAFKHITDELKSGKPDLSKIGESAHLIRDRGAAMLNWFPSGSQAPQETTRGWFDRLLARLSSDDKFSLPEEEQSHAKPSIWTEKVRFEQLHANFKIEAERMSQAVMTGQIPAISFQAQKLGEACKACHDRYRESLD